MSNWKVSKEKIELFVHPNADSLEIGKVGSYQVVVQKGLYNTGDEVIFAPEKSILTGDIKQEFEKYLSGSDKNRVKAVRLRNEISSGIIIPQFLAPNFDNYEVGESGWMPNEYKINHNSCIFTSLLFLRFTKKINKLKDYAINLESIEKLNNIINTDIKELTREIKLNKILSN
jgi:hypothetical protein